MKQQRAQLIPKILLFNLHGVHSSALVSRENCKRRMKFPLRYYGFNDAKNMSLYRLYSCETGLSPFRLRMR